MVVNNKEDRDATYFSYYSQLGHQQNMLIDQVRTSTYYNAIHNSIASFHNKTIMDVGAGNGILSFFAAQVGASKVWAMEASEMADKLKLFLENSVKHKLNSSWLSEDLIHVVKGKVEDIAKNENIIKHHSVDTLISEPIGVFLIHERMLETYITARDVYLKPGGDMFPATGTMHIAPFSDALIWNETMNKALWWKQTEFYGVDLSSMLPEAKKEFFRMPIVGTVPSCSILSHDETPSSTFTMDFRSITLEQMQSFEINIDFRIGGTGIMHGLCGWFDCAFIPNEFPVSDIDYDAESNVTLSRPMYPMILDTSPKNPVTHWQQIRFMLREPVAVNYNDRVQGVMKCRVNNMRSYRIECELYSLDSHLAVKRWKREAVWDLHDQSYNYNYYNNTTPSQFGIYTEK